MPAPEAKPGTQKQSVVSELNTPAADAARAERTENVLSGDEILHASDRSKVMERYRKHERKRLPPNHKYIPSDQTKLMIERRQLQ